MLPEHKTPPRLQQLPHLLRHTLHIPHRTQHLYTQHCIQTPLYDSLSSQDLTVFNSTRYQLVLILQIEFLELCSNVVCVVQIGLNSIDEVYVGWGEALELVAWSWAKFENFAASGVEEGGDDGGVFVGDEARGWVSELLPCR